MGVLPGKTLRSIFGGSSFPQYTFSTRYQSGFRTLEREETQGAILRTPGSQEERGQTILNKLIRDRAAEQGKDDNCPQLFLPVDWRVGDCLD